MLRNKVISFPNQAWSTDITYIKMQYGHMYLTAIIDWFSRKIMGWELSDTLDKLVDLPSRLSSVTAHRRPVKAEPLRGGWLGVCRSRSARASSKPNYPILVHIFLPGGGLDWGTIILRT